MSTAIDSKGLPTLPLLGTVAPTIVPGPGAAYVLEAAKEINAETIPRLIQSVGLGHNVSILA